MINYFKREKVLSISLILAVISAILVHPDKEYLGYIDVRVLALLFCLMLLVKGFQDIGLLDLLIIKVFGRVKSSRRMSQILILLSFFISMLVTNDVGLLTFVPFAILALKLCGQQKLTIRVVVLQTIAANLGSMFTPIGNPQNLYLFSVSGMPTIEFFRTMFPITLLSLALLMFATYFLPNEEIQMKMDRKVEKIAMNPLSIYGVLFILNLLVVFRVLPWPVVLIITAAVVFFLGNRALFKQVDYALLMTFAGFFIFVGNIGRIPAISHAIADILQGREILISAVFSQFLSNVPATILLSGFTENFAGLLIGTNIGGLGTLIASMASLISYKLYAGSENASKSKYMGVFSLYNVIGLVILLVFAGFYYG